MTSELDNLMLDPSVKPRAEAGTDVDRAAEEGHQVSLQSYEVEQGASRLEVYEQVEVARVVGRVAGHGAEKKKKKKKNVAPTRAEPSRVTAAVDPTLRPSACHRASLACRGGHRSACLGSPPCSVPLARA